MKLSRLLIVFVLACPLFAFAGKKNNKKNCRPSEDTQILIQEGGSVPVGSQYFYHTAKRLPKIIQCSEAGDLAKYYCIEWEGSVFKKKKKKTTQGGKIVFNPETGLIVDLIASTNEPGFKYMKGKELVVIDKELKKNLIELLNEQFLNSKIKVPQMTLAQNFDLPNTEKAFDKTVKVLLSLLKESMGSLHLNCKNYGTLSSNARKVL